MALSSFPTRKTAKTDGGFGHQCTAYSCGRHFERRKVQACPQFRFGLKSRIRRRGKLVLSEVHRQLLITLVHGTWGRGFFPKREEPSARLGNGTLWFEEGSPFLVRLNTELKDISHQSKALLWSGKNAIFEREKAAQVLAEYISTEHLDRPEATQLIIAHSHGGNIALRALQHLTTLDASKLDGADRAPLVVTLATPFIEIHEADLGNRPTLVRIAALLIIWLLAAALLVEVQRLFEWLLRPPITTTDVEQFLTVSQWYQSVWRTVTLVVQFSGAALVAIFGFWWLYLRAPRRRSRIKMLSEITRLGEVASGKAQRLMIIRAVDDEASLVMALGAILNYATARGIIVVYAVFVLFAGSLNFTRYGLFKGTLADNFNAQIFTALFVITAVLILLFGMLIVSRAVDGRELALSPMECQINTQSTPDATGPLRIITLVRRTYVKSLRHGIYDHEDCAKTIADWVRLQRCATV